MKKDLVPKKQATTKSRLQKRYEKLLEEITNNQAARQNLEEGMRVAAPRIQSEIRPLLGKRDILVRQRLLRLDELAEGLGIGKYDRSWFGAYLAEQACEMLNRTGFSNQPLNCLRSTRRSRCSPPRKPWLRWPANSTMRLASTSICRK